MGDHLEVLLLLGLLSLLSHDVAGFAEGFRQHQARLLPLQ